MPKLALPVQVIACFVGLMMLNLVCFLWVVRNLEYKAVQGSGAPIHGAGSCWHLKALEPL